MLNKPKAAIPTTTPTSHNGIRPVVPVFDIYLTFILILIFYFVLLLLNIINNKQNFYYNNLFLINYLIKNITRK